jgi:hypothetical protein
MSNLEHGCIGINSTHFFADGSKASAQFVARQVFRRKNPGETALHEAEHAVVAEANGTAVKRVTTVPGSGYLGLTELSRFDPLAAVAPHANGRNGTAHDLVMVSHAGADSHAATHAARHILREKRTHILEVAQTLEERRTIGRSEVLEAIDIAENGREVIIFIEKSNGSQKKISGIKTKDAHIPIRQEWFVISV